VRHHPLVIVLGIDGATWNIIKPWIAQGELPTLKHLIENGVSGNLKSSIPPVTFPAWKCYSTGKNPENFGVYYWVSVDFKNKRIKVNDSTSFRSKELWDYLGEKGLKVGIIDMPTTYPPKRVNGFMISGHPPSENCEYTYPKNLQRQLKEKYKYNSTLEYLLREEDKEKAVSQIYNLIESRFEIAEDSLKNGRIDFLHLTIYHTDVLQHFFWKDIEVRRVWQLIDRRLERLIRLLDDNGTIFIMSDHGFTKIKARFNISTWLQYKGFLMTKDSNVWDLLWKMGLNRETLYSIATRLRVLPLLKRIPGSVLRKIGRSIPTKFGTSELEGIESRIDWEKCKVVSIGPLIYVNAKENSEYNEIRNVLVQELERLRYPRRGEKIIKKIYRKEEIYKGRFTEIAPDLVVVPYTGYKISEDLGRKELFTTKKSKWIADHAQEGIFIVKGPEIAKGKVIDDARIIDLAPTILHMLLGAVPKDMDGRILWQIFKKESYYIHEPALIRNTVAERNRVRNRIGRLKILRKL